MATQFDAVARLSVDIKGFAQAARSMTAQGGQMSKVFKDLHATLNQVEISEKALAADTRKVLSVYGQMASVVSKVASALKALGSSETSSAEGAKAMSNAFASLQKSMAAITGLSEKEFQRLTRTLTLYNQMASAIQKVNQANAIAAKTIQSTRAAEEASQAKAIANEQKLADAKRRSAEQTLAAKQRLEAAQARADAAEQAAVQRISAARARADAAELASQQRLTAARDQANARRIAAANQQLAAEQRLAAAQTTAATRATAASQAQQVGAQRVAQAVLRTESAQVRLNQQLERTRLAAERAAHSQNQFGTSMSNSSRSAQALRSDLSEIEQLYKKLAQTIASSATASVSAAISHEAAFAQVLRVTQETGKGAALMREEFERLTTQLPVSFEELAKIGQLAAQTGVANEQLTKFADTVVRFSVTTGIASDQVTVLFARIADMLNLPPNQMDKFASTILRLGTISAATEAEILKVTQSIASSARAFGLSTEEVAGLSGALASLRIPPEWSRGSATRIFRDLDNAANKAGMGMTVLTEVIGMNADEITRLRQTDPGTFFLKFVEGMQKYTREGQLAAGTTRTITDVLGDLDINAVRDIDFITRLANNFSTLKTQTNEAFLEFARGTELTKQTEIVFKTARQNIDNLKDAFETFLAKVGTPFAQVLGVVAERLTAAIEAFREMPGPMKTIFSIISVGVPLMAALAAGIALYRMALIRSVRGIIAFNQVQREMNGQALNARNVWGLYRREQEATRASVAGTAAAQREAAATAAAATAATRNNTTAISAGSAAHRTYGTVMAGTMQQYSRIVPATTAATAAIQAQQHASRAATTQAASYAAAWAQTARAMPTATAAIRNGTASMQQQNAVARSVALNQQAITASSSQMGAAYISLHQAQQQATTSAVAGATATRGIGAAATAAAAGMRVAAGAVTLFRTALASIGIGLVITGLTALYYALTKTKDASKEAAQAGFEAAGGQQAFGDAVRKDEIAIKNGATVIKRMSAAQQDLSESDRARIESRLQAAKMEQTFILALGGSIEGLKKQAEGTGAAAEQARGYVKRFEAADEVIKTLTQTLKGNTFEISENTQALAEFSIQQAVMNNKASKNLEALKLLEQFGPKLRESMKLMFSDPAKSSQILSDEIERVNARLKELDKTTTEGRSPTKRQRTGPEKEEIKNLEDYISLLKTINVNVDKNKTATVGGQLAARAFGKALDDVGKGADAAVNGLDDVSESADGAGASTEELGARVEGLAAAFNSLGDFSTAMTAAIDKAKGTVEAGAEAQNKASATAEKMRDAQDKLASSLEKAGGDSKKTAQAYNDYNRSLKDIQNESDKTKAKTDDVRASFKAIMDELENVAQARMDRAQNLVRLAGRVPADVLQELEKLGPEYSSFIQDLVNTSDTELAKLIPTLRGAGAGAAGAYAKGLAELLPVIAGRGREFGDSVAANLRKSIDEAIQSGGDIGTAIARIKDAITLSDKLKIPIDVAVDIVKANGEVGKITAILDRAVAEGKLTKEATVKLKSDLFVQELTLLQEKLKNTSLDTTGKAFLNPEQYDRDRERLIKDGTFTTLQNLIGIEGIAELAPEQYKQAIELLKKYGIQVTESNALGPVGTPTINPNEYYQGLGVLTDKGLEWQRLQNQWLRPAPSVNPSTYNSDLRNLERSSWNTGSTIQANLTRTATVKIQYRYEELNQPPQRAQAADGGWIRGPGGPRADKIPAMLSNGEFVVNAAAAKRYGSLLESLNSFGQRGSRLGGMDLKAMQIGNVRDDLSGSTARGDFFRRVAAQRASTAAASAGAGPSTVVTVNNQYPREEPTSVTVNRALAFAATLGGV